MPGIFNRKYQEPIRQRLRNNATDAEKLLWSRLKHCDLLGYKFHRQQGIAKYVVDFYCPEHKLAIKIDGATHSTSEEIKRDKERQEYIEKIGVSFLRFTDSDVFENIEQRTHCFDHRPHRRRHLSLSVITLPATSQTLQSYAT